MVNLYLWQRLNIISNSSRFPLFQERINQYSQKRLFEPPSEQGSPIHIARYHGVTRKELRHVLDYCYVGKYINVPKEAYLQRMKDDVYNVLEDEGDSDAMQDYKDQLNRWIREYPNNPVFNEPQDPEKDPNMVEFPIPADTLANVSDLRKYLETFEFDTELPEGGYFNNEPNIYTEVGNEHEQFVTLLSSRVDDSLPDLNLEIEGEVAWEQIKLELFKDDVTTGEQVKIWNQRAKRTNLNDEEWLSSRREDIYNALIARYEWDSSKVDPYRMFFDNLNWEAFQKLCEQDFILPVKNNNQSHTIRSTGSCGIDEGMANFETRPTSKGSNKSLTSVLTGKSIRSNATASNRSTPTRPRSKLSITSNGSNDLTLVGTVAKLDDDDDRPRSSPSIRSIVDESGSMGKHSETENSDEESTNGIVKVDADSDHVNTETERQNTETDNVNIDHIDQKPVLEKMDSGLELDSPDQVDNGVDEFNNDDNPNTECTLKADSRGEMGAGSRCSNGSNMTGGNSGGRNSVGEFGSTSKNDSRGETGLSSRCSNRSNTSKGESGGRNSERETGTTPKLEDNNDNIDREVDPDR